MEKAEKELLLELINTNPKLKELYREHQRLEKQVANIGRYISYSPSLSLQQARLKKLKLVNKEQIVKELTNHRRHDTEAVAA